MFACVCLLGGERGRGDACRHERGSARGWAGAAGRGEGAEAWERIRAEAAAASQRKEGGGGSRRGGGQSCARACVLPPLTYRTTGSCAPVTQRPISMCPTQWFTPTSGTRQSCESMRATSAHETSGPPMPGPFVYAITSSSSGRTPACSSARCTSPSAFSCACCRCCCCGTRERGGERRLQATQRRHLGGCSAVAAAAGPCRQGQKTPVACTADFWRRDLDRHGDDWRAGVCECAGEQKGCGVEGGRPRRRRQPAPRLVMLRRLARQESRSWRRYVPACVVCGS